MRLKKYEDMNLQELDVMKEISSIGTSHAATALSKGRSGSLFRRSIFWGMKKP